MTASADQLSSKPTDRHTLRPLTALKSSYALIYAVDGAILPIFAVFLAQQHHLNPAQIGGVLAISAVSAIVAPPLITLVADRFGNANRLLFTTLLISAVALFAFSFAESYWWIVILYTAYGLAREPIRPLLDGIFFSARHSLPELASARFHQIRLWGTFGFMIPGIAFYFILSVRQDSLAFLPLASAALAFTNLFLVGQLPASAPPASGTDRASFRTTTRDAIAVLAKPRTGVFVLAMFMMQVAMSAFMGFYPLQATAVGISPRWLGLLTVLAVAIELGFMAAFGWFVRVMGWRGFITAGALVAAIRMATLAAFPSIGTVIGTQVVHGFIIIVTMVGARALLDRKASDGVRYTVQGLFAMITLGGGRIIGSAFGGELASRSLSAMFWASAAVSALAAGLLWWSLREFVENESR